MGKPQSYRDRTVNSPNPIVRFSHRRRLRTSVSIIPEAPGWLLDYGCGDGQMLADLSTSWQDRSFGYEPYLDVLSDVSDRVFKAWQDIERLCAERGKPDVVTVFEVFEHFPVRLQESTLDRISDVLSDDGQLVISVPVEGGLPALVKNGLRRARYGGKGVYSGRNILRSALWRPVPEAREGSDYLTHMGFYYTDFLTVLSRRFEITETVASPFAGLPVSLNSQLFIRARRKP